MLLSASTAPVLDFGGLAVDPSSYAADSILVRMNADWQQQAGAAFAADAILAGAVFRPLTVGGSGLYEVALPEGVGVGAALDAFQAASFVEYVQPDYRITLQATPDDPRFGEMWNLENASQTGGTLDADIDATGAWDVTTGSGSVVVAVTDTGVQWNHPDLMANIWVNPGEIAGDGIDNDGNGFVDDVHGYDFINEDGNPMDDQGHGTHVAGTIGAVGDNGIGVTGINWNVQIMALKFLGSDGSGTTSDAIRAIDYAVANGAEIINASWGGDPFSQALFDAIADARNADVIFVAAAGNGNAFGVGLDNDATPFYPSGYDLDNIIAVAAVDHNDNLASFSNYGATTVDLAAPGVNILSTTLGGGYGLNSGTSMAAPHVAGVAALVRDLHPEWTAQQVISQVLNSADPLPGLQGVTVTGGRLNAAAAVGNPQPPPPPPPPTTLPVVEDFGDGFANHFSPQAGNWSVSGGRYDAVPVAQNDDLAAVATIRLETPLPADLEIQTVINADEGFVELFGIVFSDNLTNGFIVFDYVGPEDFKFASADMDADRWVIGRRDASGWSVDAFANGDVNAAVNYQVRAVITGGNTVALFADGDQRAVHTFSESIVDGDVGLGMRNSTTHFDDVIVREFVPLVPGTLPLSESFDDPTAEHLQVRSGLAFVSDGLYHVTATSLGDGITTVLLADPLPDHLELQATFNADDASPDRFSNSFLIFDYQTATDFKFAGGYAGSDQWLIGHRTSSDWVTDASVTFTIDPLTDYDLRLVIEDGNTVTLFADGTERVSLAYSESVVDGEVGLGTRNADSRFDDFSVREVVPPPSTSVPHSEDFSDGVADFFEVRSGVWDASTGRYAVVPAIGSDGISTLRLGGIPDDLEIAATINVDNGTADRFSNAAIIFDYQSPTDFKFAGAYAGSDLWLIGHRTSFDWITDASISAPIDALTDYDLRLTIENGNSVVLSADGVPRVTFTYASSVTDGEIGLGTRNGAIARFDDFSVSEPQVPPPPTPVSLPLFEDFSDGVGDGLVVQSGQADASGGEYQVFPVSGGDAISTLLLSDPLPSDVQMQARVNIDNAAGGLYSNAVLIFDYQSATDFKFAGAYAGTDQWVIGHRTSSAWVTDAFVSAPIDGLTDYDLQMIIRNGNEATLFANGTERVSLSYAESLLDGQIGLGTWNAVSRFDDYSVQQYVPPPSASLPHADDFSDGTADFFEVRSGAWDVAGGRYAVVPAPSTDGISTLRLEGIPDDVDVQVTFNADDASTNRFTNSFIIFDYQSPTDFKFAGAYLGSDQWLIGHRTSFDWVTDAFVSAPINPLTDYDLRLTIENGNSVVLSADGVPRVTYNFASSVTDGDLGLGTRSGAISRFDDFSVQEFTPPPSATLPHADDFSDGTADFFEVRSGTWDASTGRYSVVPPIGSDGISTLRLESIPADLDVQATFNGDNGTANRFSNSFLIFDYQSPTDFKFAGAYLGTDQWLIGHRTAFDWVTDVSVTAPIDALTDYQLRLTIQNGNSVVLYADGVQRVSLSYASSVIDGAIGLGTRNAAISRFDDFSVQALTGGTQVQSQPEQVHFLEESVFRERSLTLKNGPVPVAQFVAWTSVHANQSGIRRPESATLAWTEVHATFRLPPSSDQPLPALEAALSGGLIDAVFSDLDGWY